MKQPGPILVADRFPALRKQLAGLLPDLSEEEWDRPTAAPNWFVKDVVAHLLGGDVSILSGMRDGFGPRSRSVQDYAGLRNGSPRRSA